MKKLFLFASAVALLAGCSKELAEVAAVDPVINGSNKIVASYESDAETRSYFNGERMAWNSGDALGVISQEDGSGNANFGYGGEAFYGDLMSVTGNDFFIYYPWKEDKNTTDLTSVKFTIPSKQKYNHLHSSDSKYGSFASGIVPAVAKASIDGEKSIDSELEAEMLPVATYLAFPIHGNGKAKTIELQIKNGNDYLDLASTISVDLTKESEETNSQKKTETIFFTPTVQEGGEKKIILDCGEGVRITENLKWFLFVVNPNFELKGALEFEVKVNGEPLDSYELPATTNMTVKRNGLQALNGKGFEWIEGTTGSYVIKTAEQFIEYAYAATNGYLEGAPEAMFTDEDHSALKTAMIVEPLDMSSINVEDRLPDYEDENGEWDAYKKAVFYDWYYKNGNAIETIGGKLQYSIVGNVAGEAAVIEGLNVIGNGVFVGSTKPDEEAPVVSKIVLKNTTVTSKEKAACFVTENVWYFDALDVTVDGGELKAATAKSKALFNNVQSCKLVDESFNIELTNDAYPTGVALYANSLDVYTDTENTKDITLGSEFFTADGKDVLFGQVVAQGRDDKDLAMNGTILTVPSYDAAKAVINKINETVEYAGGWFSVVTRKADKTVDTSYWTGLRFQPYTGALRFNNDGVMTAEEFVYAIDNGATIDLTNNICLLYKSYKAGNVSKSVVVNGNDFTISQVTVTNGLAGAKTNTTFNDLTIRATFLDVDKATDTPYLLAKSGIAKNVKAEILTYRYNNGVESAKDGIVAGLFYEGTIDQLVKTTGCEVSGATKYSNKELTDKFGALYAKVNADLANETNKYTVPAYKGAYDPFAVMTVVCSSETVDGLHSGNIYVTFEGTVPTPASAYVNWELKKGEISDGFSVSFLAKGESTTANQAVYDGSAYVDSTEELQNVIGSMEPGEKVTIKLVDGDFSLKNTSSAQFTWPKNAEITFVGNGAENTTLTNFDYTTAEGTTVVFENLTLSVFENTTNHTAMGLKGAKAVTLKNVDIVGEFHAFAGDCTFEGCSFYYGGGANNTMTRYGLYIETAGKTTLTNCVFDTACKKDVNLETKAILVYSAMDGSGYNSITGDIEITGCEFKAGTTPTQKAAIEIHSELFKEGKNSTLTISNTTYDAETYKGGLYREVSGVDPTQFYKVVVK